MKHFFACMECGNVIIADAEQLYDGMKDCPACLAPGRAGVADPFEVVDVDHDG